MPSPAERKFVSDAAKAHGVWLLIGSMAVRLEERRAANRAFLFAPDGSVAVKYDKLHMFDVDLPNGESWKESNVYRPGDKAVLADRNLPRDVLVLGIAKGEERNAGRATFYREGKEPFMLPARDPVLY